MPLRAPGGPRYFVQNHIRDCFLCILSRERPQIHRFAAFVLSHGIVLSDKHRMRRYLWRRLNLLWLQFLVLGGVAADWTGTWETQWRGGGALLRLEQDGNRVTGSYPLYEGRVEGTVEAQQFSGQWTEASGRSGGFVFSLARDGRTFMGRFDSGEWWTGKRLSDRQDFVRADANTSSPRETIRTLLNAANAARNGTPDLIAPALETIDFSRADIMPLRQASGPWLPGEKLEYIQLLFHVMDDRLVRVWAIPGAQDVELSGEDSVDVTLTAPGSAPSLQLSVSRDGSSWKVDPLPATQLQELLKGVTYRSPTDHLRLRSPRDALRTFLEELGRFDSGGRVHVRRVLHVEALGGGMRDDEVRLLALYLKEILDRIGYILYQEIPNDPDQSDPYIHFQHGAGSIVIAPWTTEEGATEWRFTVETLRRLRPLYAAIEEIPLVDGVSDISSPSVYFKIRSRLRQFSASLLNLWGPMEVWQWISLTTVTLLGLPIAWLLAGLVVGCLNRWRRGGMPHPSGWMNRTRWPLRAVLLGVTLKWALGPLGLPEAVALPVSQIAATVAWIGAVWLAQIGMSVAAEAVTRSVGTAGNEAVLISLSMGILRVLTLLASALIIADVWSVRYTSVLAGLGIGGLAVALAAQQTLQNMIAGFTLFVDNPLSVGDFCRYGSKLGTVEQIGLRSTRIRSLDRTVVSVPNSEFAGLQLENFAKRDRILLRTTLQFRYETTPDQLRYLMAELRRLLIAHPRVHPDPARVRFVGFGEHSLDVEIFTYVLTSDFAEFLAIQEDLNLRMMDIVRESGTGFAFPSQVNYLARDTGVDADQTRKAEEAVAEWIAENRLPFPQFPEAEIRALDGKLDYPPKGSPSAGKPQT